MITLSLKSVIIILNFSGAYGAAVLYRKKDDDSLVILKEINMHDLNAAERQLALNEVY
jgi:NIMA (never in mitosis gene a)-related kinase